MENLDVGGFLWDLNTPKVVPGRRYSGRNSKHFTCRFHQFLCLGTCNGEFSSVTVQQLLFQLEQKSREKGCWVWGRNRFWCVPDWKNTHVSFAHNKPVPFIRYPFLSVRHIRAFFFFCSVQRELFFSTGKVNKSKNRVGCNRY